MRFLFWLMHKFGYGEGLIQDVISASDAAIYILPYDVEKLKNALEQNDYKQIRKLVDKIENSVLDIKFSAKIRKIINENQY